MATWTNEAINCFATNKGVCNHPTSPDYHKRCRWLDNDFAQMCSYWENGITRAGSETAVPSPQCVTEQMSGDEGPGQS